MQGRFIIAIPKDGGKHLWLTDTGNYSPHSWKAFKFPKDFNFELAIEFLEKQYKTFRFDRSY
jgi:hypothetical protein